MEKEETSERNNCVSFMHLENIKNITTNGKSQEMPAPLCRAAIVVGPDNEGIQKKPSVNRPLK